MSKNFSFLTSNKSIKNREQIGIQRNLQVLQSEIEEINKIRKELTVFAY